MKTRILKIKKDSDIPLAVESAAKALMDGSLVAFPTETVYGVGACANHPDALAALRHLKERSDAKPFTLHIGRSEDISLYLPERNLYEKFFFSKVWPGPVTVISHLTQSQIQHLTTVKPDLNPGELYYRDTIGIRYPDDPFCKLLLGSIDCPIVASSANFAGKIPPVSAGQVMEELNGKIDLIIDSGETRYKGPSTIVDLNENQINVLREGVVPDSYLKKLHPMTIIFVCTGNTCRSPMAAGFGRSILAQKTGCPIDQLPQKGYNIISAGIMAFPGAPATNEAIRACQTVGIDISQHEACVLTVDLIRKANLIFAMDFPHYRAIIDLEPQARDYTMLLLENKGIADPIGQSFDVYRQCAIQIAEGVSQRLG